MEAGGSKMDCIFCKIIEGKIPSVKIYEDDHVLGFKEIEPQAPVHYLFVPKKHHESLVSIPKSEIQVLGQMLAAIQTTAAKEGFDKKGFRTVMNTNKEGGQSVFHVHFHVMAGKQLGGNLSGV
jgi:histidine triad (HIT) family protein